MPCREEVSVVGPGNIEEPTETPCLEMAEFSSGINKLLTMEPQKTTVLQEHERTKVTGSRHRADEKRRIEAPSAQTGHTQPWSSFEETTSDGHCPGNAEEFYPRYQGVEESAIENFAVDLQAQQLTDELFVSKAEDRPVELLACSLEVEHLVCEGNADSYRASKHAERVETKVVAKKVEANTTPAEFVLFKDSSRVSTRALSIGIYSSDVQTF